MINPLKILTISINIKSIFQR